MTQLVLEAAGAYSGRRKVSRWWNTLAAHASGAFAFLACYPPYTLDYDPPSASEWNRYEPASDWLKAHQADPIRSPA